MDVANQDATAPAVSIVIPTWNAIESLLKCLKSVGAHTPWPRYEVIVVDNGSTDQTGPLLSRLSFVRVLSNATNVGFARACNQGAAIARAPMLLFLNDDAQPQMDWLPPLIMALEQDANVGLASAKLVRPDSRIEQAGYALAYATPYPLSPLPLFRRRPFAALTQTRTFAAVTATCLLLRKSLFQELGGFDEGFINGMEDVDLCLRAKERNLASVVVASSLVIHEPRFPAERLAFSKQNMERLNQRWRPQELALDFDFRRFATVTTDSSVRPPLSIVAVAQDALTSGAACVEHLLAYAQANDEVIVVDDTSSAAFSGWAKSRMQSDQRLRHLASSCTVGFLEAAREGLKSAQNSRVMVIPTTLRIGADCLDVSLTEAIDQKPNGLVFLRTRPSGNHSPLGPYEPRRPTSKNERDNQVGLNQEAEIASGAFAGDQKVVVEALSRLADEDSPNALAMALRASGIPFQVATSASVRSFAECDTVARSPSQRPLDDVDGLKAVVMIRVYAADRLQGCLRMLYAAGVREDDIWLLLSPELTAAPQVLDAIEETQGTRRVAQKETAVAETINGILQKSSADIFILLDEEMLLPRVSTETLFDHFRSESKLALLGPTLNVSRGEQVASQTVAPHTANGLALRLSWQNRHQRRNTLHLEPACLFGRRKTLLQLGLNQANGGRGVGC